MLLQRSRLSWRSWLNLLIVPGPGPDSGQPGPPGPPAAGILGALRQAALTVTGILVTAASLVSFAESYRGLYEWARGHGLAGFWAAVWPMQVDAFIAVGELSLFVALVDRWPARSRVLPWTVTICGLAVSVAGNIGHVAGPSLTARATAAVPPLAASAAMAVGLGVLKRVVGSRDPGLSHEEGRPGPARISVPAESPSSSRSLSEAEEPSGDTVSPAATAPPPAATPAENEDSRPGGSQREGSPRQRPSRARVTAADVARHFSDQIEAGKVPSQRAIRGKWHVGSDRARELRDDVVAMTGATLPARRSR